MDEGDTLETESTQVTDPTSERSLENMTFEELKEKAWQEAEPTLVDWKDKLDKFSERKAHQIDKALRNISILYGESLPEKEIVVNLNFFPEKDRESGEPAQQGDKEKSFDPKIGDVIYFVSERTILPRFTKKDIADIPTGTISRIIHETEHSLFQKENFRQLTLDSEEVPEINKVLDKIIPTQEHYTEFTNELITSYLDNYALKILQSETDEVNQEIPKHFNFTFDKDSFGKVLEKAIKSDVEVWKGNGPRTDLREAWQKRLGNLPNGYELAPKETIASYSDGKSKTPSVYEIGRSLDLSLAEKYVKEGRKMDVEFVSELYKMVDEKISEAREV